jgi:hypothetical protein
MEFTMRRSILLTFTTVVVCWSQSVTGPLPKSASPVVKAETPPSTFWDVLLRALPVLLPALVGITTLLIANHHNRKTNEANQKHEMKKWRAEKQLDVLGRIGQLIVQTNEALKKWELAMNVGALHDGPDNTTAISQSTIELKLKRQELSALMASAAIALSGDLWKDLKSLQDQFSDASEQIRGDKTERKAQLENLSAGIDTFIDNARKESLSILPF